MQRDSKIRDHIGRSFASLRLALSEPGCVRRPLLQGAWPKSSDVASGVGIGVVAIPAAYTAKVCLLGAVGSRGVAATGTALRGLARINKDNWDAHTLSFVANETHQLPESPRRHHTVEPLAAFRSLANPIQAFKHQDRIRVLRSKINKLVAELVVLVAHPASFLALAALDAVHSLVSPITFAKVCKVFPLVSGGLAVEAHHPVRQSSRGMVDDAQVNADERRFSVTDGGRWGYPYREHGIPLAVALKQLGVSLNQRKPISKLGRNAKWEPNVLASLAGRNAQHRAVAVSLQRVGIDTKTNTLRVVDLGKRTSLALFHQANIGTSQRNRSVDRHASVVRRQTQLARWTINRFVQPVPAAGAFLFRHFQAQLNCIRERFGSLLKPLSLAPSGLDNLNNDRFFYLHEHIVYQLNERSSTLTGWSLLTPYV